MRFRIGVSLHVEVITGRINGRQWDILQQCYLLKPCSKAIHKSWQQSDLDKPMAEMLLPV